MKEGFGNQISLCRDRGLNPGPPEQKSDTLPLDQQVEKTRRTEDSRATPPCSSKRPAYRSKSMLDRVPNRPSTSRSTRC
uniref:(California timema) hypothetical protein n=1 Tax=Timema californicum TaxID=61474 RepID=A0A7R9PER4_TIMCA|nr:unnamed protein product [Timema californicum]